MTRLLKTITTLFILAMLASCASLVGPRDVDLPLAKLQAGVDKRFPLNRRMLELLDVQLSHPQVSLYPGEERIGISIDAAIVPAFRRTPWRGNLSLSGRLVVDANRNAILISDPRIENFTMDGVDESRQRQLARVAGLLVDEMVRDHPLYTFRPEDLRYAGVQFAPTHIRTSERGLSVTIAPAR